MIDQCPVCFVPDGPEHRDTPLHDKRQGEAWDAETEEYDDGATLIAGVLYDNETGEEIEVECSNPDDEDCTHDPCLTGLNPEGDPTRNGAFG